MAEPAWRVTIHSPGFFAVGGAGVVGFGVDEGAGCFLVADGEAQVTVQVDGGEFGGKVADHAEIVVVAAHTTRPSTSSW